MIKPKSLGACEKQTTVILDLGGQRCDKIQEPFSSSISLRSVELRKHLRFSARCIIRINAEATAKTSAHLLQGVKHEHCNGPSGR